MAGNGRVLVTDDASGHGRSAVAAVRAAAAAGYSPTVASFGAGSVAAASRHCAGRVALPPPDDDRYGPALRAELMRGGYLAALPTSDAGVLACSATGAELVDKAALERRAVAAGIPVLPGRTFGSGADLVAAASSLDYPVVVKAQVKAGAGQLPVARVESPHHLAGYVDVAAAFVVQPFVSAPMWAAGGVAWRGTLPALAQQRYERTWPVEAGTASAAVTVPVEPQVEEHLRALLTGYEGIFQAQFLGPYLIDLNPRPYGSLPLAVKAGANLVGIYCDLLAGRQVAPVRARAGVRYRWVEGDLRHLGQRVRRREMTVPAAIRALRPHRGTAHSVVSVTDPGPALVRLRYAAGQLGRG